jgi:hypothetical protein
MILSNVTPAAAPSRLYAYGERTLAQALRDYGKRNMRLPLHEALPRMERIARIANAFTLSEPV